MNENKIDIIVVYNGEEINLNLPLERPINSIIAEVLKDSPDLNPAEFYLKTQQGDVLERHVKLSDVGITSGSILFLNKNDGGGGNG